MFEAQTENFHCNALTLICFVCGIIQRLDFSVEVPGWGPFFFFKLRKDEVLTVKISYSFFVNLRIRAN